MTLYTRKFFDTMATDTMSSAQVIAPLVTDALRPRSVVDVGCGVGTWLAVFRGLGVEDVLGVDGEWVDAEQLQIPAARFLRADLTKPLDLGRRFDLVLSLEVAEHLPASCAGAFVDSLIRCGGVVLFSAAIPFQGGVNHVNEQWPDYWAKLFEERGYLTIDWVRREVWDNGSVWWYYAQNTLLFCDGSSVDNSPFLRRALEGTCRSQLNIVHPKQFLHSRRLEVIGVRDIVASLPGLVVRGLIRRVRKFVATR